MVAVLMLAIAMVLLVDRFYGHSTLAFAAAIVVLVIANAPMVRFNCPGCGRNLFFRGVLVVPWPRRICRTCGHDCDSVAPQNR